MSRLPVLSRRTASVAPMALAGLLAGRPAGEVIDLALGIPPDGPPPAVVEAAVRALRQGEYHQYTDAAGLPELRRAVAAQLRESHGVELDADQEVTITCGSTEGALATLIAVTDPGDEVILLEPFFENHAGAVELVGAVPRFVPLRRPGWRLDLNRLSAAITPRTKAILYSTPHNPTGRVFDQDETEGILRLCAEHGLVAITDEVYAGYSYDGPHVSPLAPSRAREHSVMLGSLSKSIQISGWRVAYAVASAPITAGLRQVHTRLTLGAASPLQAGVVSGISSPDAEIRERFRQRRDQVVRALREMALEVHPAEGGWFVLAGVAGLGWRSDELVPKLLHEAGVLVAPGASFFADPAERENWVRLTLVRDAETTARGLERLAGFFSR